jgi:hypothetical protein
LLSHEPTNKEFGSFPELQTTEEIGSGVVYAFFRVPNSICLKEFDWKTEMVGTEKFKKLDVESDLDRKKEKLILKYGQQE